MSAGKGGESLRRLSAHIRELALDGLSEPGLGEEATAALTEMVEHTYALDIAVDAVDGVDDDALATLLEGR
jgi:hypothetical protein